MKILLCHNSYKRPGGEDIVFQEESQLLERYGHEVIRYHRSNHELDELSSFEKFGKTIWNRQSEKFLFNLLRKEQPAIVHCTNIFPLISPSIYRAARRNNVPVVQSVHNYRLVCPNAMLLREGNICNDCVGKALAWPAVYHGCYRNSRSASATVMAMLAYHRSIGTWAHLVNRYIALTDFMRNKLIQGGLPENKIKVKPNFVGKDTGVGSGQENYAVYVGRLSEEKGIRILLDAWHSLNLNLELRILGDGPLLREVQDAANSDARINSYGHKNAAFVSDTLGNAKFLIVPSIWNEPFGLNVIEAFSKGTPVIASNVGSLPELVSHQETGLLFDAGQPRELCDAVEFLCTNPAKLETMRNNARNCFEQRYTAERNYQLLSTIYRDVLRDADPAGSVDSSLTVG